MHSVRKNCKGFTLIEMAMVIAIIGLLMAIALPTYIERRNYIQKNICLDILRQIDAAKDQWAMDTGAVTGDAIIWIQVMDYIKRDDAATCPAGGSYTLKRIGTSPTCSILGHELQY